MLYRDYTNQCSACGAAIPDGEILCAKCRNKAVLDRITTCPFCGASDIVRTVHPEHTDDGCYCVLCEACGATGPKADTDERAITLWNNRLCDEYDY